MTMDSYNGYGCYHLSIIDFNKCDQIHLIKKMRFCPMSESLIIDSSTSTHNNIHSIVHCILDELNEGN